ncbi:hypothetical protein CDV26_08200 [Francisella halioticida]|uniref:LysR substrate-binding domain-containing protein n=1 Tax=Francisella halioticida TaxID=549298 RepID=A0ABN5AWT9_9GAMM|nr:substrate binding domain-containing protein [Francisella halioticida]ASG68371.1 hypothetical protein CDV26_08200 [Francisella halioticida]
MIQEVREKNKNTKGKIRISTPIGFHNLILASIMSDFLKLYPNIEIYIYSSAAYDQLPELEKYDLAFRAGDPSRYPLTKVFRKVLKYKFVVCVSPQYIKEKGMPKSLKDLKKHNCLGNVNFSKTKKAWNFIDENSPISIEVKSNINVDLGDLAIKLSLGNTGILYIPDFLVIKYINNGDLVQLLSQYDTPEEHICWYHSYNNKNIPYRIKLLSDFIFKNITEVNR